MRLCIDMGHTPASPGASGYIDELEKDRALGKRLVAELARRGHEVLESTPADSVAYPDEVNQRVAFEHANGPFDLFVSVHFNAFNGEAHGTEVLYFDGDPKGEYYANIISANLSGSLGTTNRGAKPNDWVGVIKNTWSTAVLIEVCFVDSYEDCVKWWNAPWDDIVGSIADGIEGKAWSPAAEVAQTEVPQPEQPPKNGQEKAPESDSGKLAAVAIEVIDAMLRAIDNDEVKGIIKEHLKGEMAW